MSNTAKEPVKEPYNRLIRHMREAPATATIDAEVF